MSGDGGHVDLLGADTTVLDVIPTDPAVGAAPGQLPDGQLPDDQLPDDQLPGGDHEVWHLRLYVAGASPKSLKAFANLRRLCDEHLAGRYSIEVVDLVESPRLARTDDIVAIPPLVRRLPAPMRKIVGDLSNTDRVLLNLQLHGERT